jgi:glycosyltransferase involved in cell wall biosynthesis
MTVDYTPHIGLKNIRVNSNKTRIFAHPLKVSIITIVYNNQKCIADCIRSVINQSYPNIEHIVIDGGSTDGTQKKILAFRKNLAYYISEKDSGLYEALNKGIRHSTGDVIGIMHSDDTYYETDTIKKVIDKFLESDADLVHANGQFVDKENTDTVMRIYPSKKYHKRNLKFGWIPLHTTIYVKRKIYEQYGLYDQSYSIAGDYEISLRWFKNDLIKKVFLNEWVVKMRLGGISTTPNMQKLKSEEDLRIIRRYSLFGYFTLGCKIARKIPQYLIPRFIHFH